MGHTYKKSKGNAGLDGVQFQLNLLTVCLLNALHSRKNWKISTENQEAGKYDDIVIELPENGAVLIQAKHKDNKKITKDLLLTHNSKNSDFSLPKYFFSYEEIKNKFKAKTVIICTNTDIDMKGLEDIIIHHHLDLNSMLYHEDHNYSFFTFNENLLPELKTKIENYYDENLQGKRTDKTVITDENVREFLKNLQFFSNYPSGIKMDKVIGKLLPRLKKSTLFRRTSTQEIYRKVEDWFKQPKGEYLTDVRTRAMFCEIKSDKYCESLEHYNLLFEYNDFDFTDSKRIFHIKTDGGHLLQVLKVYRALQGDKSTKLFINPDDNSEVQKQMIEAFELRHYTFLIMTWSKITEEVSGKLRQILEKDQYKKVILISDENNIVNRYSELEEFLQLDGSVAFDDLSEDSQEKLLRSETIVFQGDTISLEELFTCQTTEDYAKFLDSETLEKIVRGEEVKVGRPLLDLDEDIARYFINRTFLREMEQTEDDRGDNGKIHEFFSQESIYEVEEKVVSIADGAGMGKSTVLAKLAVDIKERDPHLWVVKINLSDYTKALKDSLRNNRKTISVTELLDSQEATKLSNRLERLLFATKEKVILMLDGVDEISPDYTDLILSLLRECQQADNFAKIFITTRPHVTRDIEEILTVVSFTMLAFTQDNQVDFLTRYWMHNLELDGSNKSKCGQYAEALIAKMSSWIQSYHDMENHFTAIPLQVRMLAEIFQENIRTESADWDGCKQYLSGEEAEPKLPEKIKITELYDKFIVKKRDVFMDKANPNGIPAANQALSDQFDECLDHHRLLALEAILNKSQSDLFSSCHRNNKNMESYLLKIGIVQKSGDDFQFLHRTFAEYFVAESILRELEVRNTNVAFQRLVVDEILLKPEFLVVRAFLDNFLGKVVDSLPSTIFESYKTTHQCDLKERVYQDNPMFVLSKEGYVALLQLILKNINFKIIKGREVNIKESREYFDRACLETNRPRNTLTELEILVGEGGVNIRDTYSDTLLQVAIERDQLEMVKFLIEQGADTNSTDGENRSVLFLAAWNGCLNVVKYLVEIGTEVNERDKTGRTAIHMPAWFGFLDTIKYLVACGIDVNVQDIDGITTLHLASLRGAFDTIKYFVDLGADVNVQDGEGQTALHFIVQRGKACGVRYLIEHGADVNIRDKEGRTALHLAARRDRLDVVKCLVEAGVDVNLIDGEGRTAIDLASSKGYSETVAFLRECDVGGSMADYDDGTTLCMSSVALKV